MTWMDPLTTSAITARVVTMCAALYLVDTITFAGMTAARLWAVAFTAGTFTAFAYMIWSFIPQAWVAVAAGNASFVASIGFLWLGCRRFNDPRLRWQSWVVAVAVVWTFVAAAVPASGGGPWAGAGVMFASMAVQAGLACIETRQAPLSGFTSGVTLTVVMGAVFLYYSARTAVFALLGPESALFQDWFGTPSTSIVTIVLTIAALASMMVLRLQGEAGERGISAQLTIQGDGFLDRRSFTSVLSVVLSRTALRRSVTTVLAVDLEDERQIAAAFGERTAALAVTTMRNAVARAAPTTAFLGFDGGAHVLVGLPGAGAQESMRLADRVAQLVTADIAQSEGLLSTVIGVGVAAAHDGDAADLVLAAVAAAARSAANLDGAPVLADAGSARSAGDPVAETSDRLDPAG